MRDHDIDPLDEDLPLGDGTADTEATVSCPYCGELVIVALDPSEAPVSDYIEDCEVCCQPWAVHVVYDHDGHALVTLNPLE
jgi:cysteine-rich CPXCG protein